MSRRTLPLAAAGAAIAFAAALAGPALPAFAHNTVVAVSPAEGSTVTEQPGTVSVETSDALLVADGAGAMDVVGPDGRHYAIECPTITGPVASVAADLGPAGEYTVVWRVVSADGHPISGDFSFDWQPADGVPLADGTTDAACATSGGSEDAAGPGDAVGTAGDVADPARAGAVTDLLWIGGGVLAVLAAAGVALLFVRRRPAGAQADAAGGTLEAPGSDSGSDDEAPPAG